MKPHLDERGEAVALIAAAGSGQRLGAGRPKALVEVGGLSLLSHSLAAASECPNLRGAVVAAPPGRLDEFSELVAMFAVPEDFDVSVVSGGQTRSGSVAAALAAVDSELVVVHDAARIFAAPELFSAVLASLEADPSLDAAVAAARVSDTIKREEDPGPPPVVERTLERERLWAVQTPQAFRVAALREAITAAGPEVLASASDDAALIEANGGRVALVAADPSNFKLTTPLDLRLAEALFAGDI